MTRFVLGLLLSRTGLSVGSTVPVQVLLVLRVDDLVDDPAPVVGLVVGVGAASSLVTGPLAVRVADRAGSRFGGRRTWLLLGSLGTGLALAAIGAAGELWQVGALWCAAQTLSAFQAAATDGLCADRAGVLRRSTASGIAGLSHLFGPLLGLCLARALPAGSAGQWYVVAAVAALFGQAAVGLVRDGPAPPRERTAFRLAVRVRPFRSRPFTAVWVLRFLTTCGFAAVSLSGVSVVDRFDMGAEEAERALSVLLVASTVVPVASGVAARRFTERRQRQGPALVVSAVLSAAGASAVALAPDLGPVLAGVVVHAAGIGVFVAVDVALCARLPPGPDDTGETVAILGLASALPWALVPSALPVLLPLGGFTLFHAVFAALGLLALPALRYVPTTHEPEAVHDGSGTC